MSLSLVQSRALLGLEAAAVTVEVHLANGLPSFTLVGPGRRGGQGSARARCARRSRTPGWNSPATSASPSNLAPADLPKDSGRFDLPIALGILAASGQIDAPAAGRPRVRRRALLVRASCGPCVVRWPWRWRCTRAAWRRGWCCRPTARRRPRWCRARGVRRAAPARRGAGSSCAEPARCRRRTTPPADSGWARVAPQPGRGRAPYAGPGRREGPRRRQAGAGDRGGRRPQPADGRPAGLGQVDAGPALRRAAAADERRGGAGERGRRQPGRALRDRALDAPADRRHRTTRPAPWRWWAAARRRGRARSRWRTTACCSSTSSRVRPRRPGGPARAAGDRHHHHLARARRRRVPGALPADRRR